MSDDLRLAGEECPRCGCWCVRNFECGCGEVHSDYCVNCGRFTSLARDEHVKLSEVDVRCARGRELHDHDEGEKLARIDDWQNRVMRPN